MQAFQVTENWYLTGALELEGKIDPNHILAAMLEAEGTVAEAIGAWKYLLDAAKAGTVEIAVGLQITDTEEELTVHVRNSVLHVTEGLAESVDSVVALPSSAVVSVDPSQARTVEGDTEAFARLTSYLDTEIVGFYMHQR